MSNEFSFPGLYLNEEDPNSRFLDLFNSFSNQYPNIGQFLQPDDPDLLKYQELASQPSDSESLIRSYLEEMPEREQYKPGFKQKMIATLIGSLAGDPGRAFAMARSEVQRPYTEAVEEWKMRGPTVSTSARLADAGRNRELQALRYGLQTKAGTAKSEAQSAFRKEQEARRIAAQIEAEERANREDAEGDEARKFRQNMSQQVFDMQKDMNEWRKAEAARDNTARDEAAKARDQDQAAKAASLDQVNKRLSAYASQQGIDTSQMTALDVAKSIAFQRAKANPAFGDIIQQDESGNWTVVPPKYGTDRPRILQLYINNLTQKLLRGEF